MGLETSRCGFESRNAHHIEAHSSIIEKQERYLLSNDNIIGVRECVSIWAVTV